MFSRLAKPIFGLLAVLDYTLCSPEEMQQLKSAGVKVIFFGVRSPECCRQLMKAGFDFPLVDYI